MARVPLPLAASFTGGISPFHDRLISDTSGVSFQRRYRGHYGHYRRSLRRPSWSAPPRRSPFFQIHRESDAAGRESAAAAG